MASAAFTVEFNRKGEVLAVKVGDRRVESRSLRKAPLSKVNTVTVPIHYLLTANSCYIHSADCRWWKVC